MRDPLARKVGEAGAMASPQAIIAAVLDALAPSRVTHIDMPATPERIVGAPGERRDTQ